ncbi:uncharacterized protein F4822DRAFT_236555 [Hypoxylon trugodes]|uniref:uncharacterized protein n=1 Tax=Hypoxylon trugodes TaxID=326681 RepID=UPI002190F2D7|nr:uncharacterized protein F4822DRAFT_236555 [Hypoxylon trugodes]KAI1388167.1 hypothetical protein F4822DRAFT_236555 [Hypoxylon trugodes]
MDPSKQTIHQSDDTDITAQQVWKPDLPHHFAHPGAGAIPVNPGFIHGLPGPIPGAYDALDNLASAAAISDSYAMQSQASSSSQRAPGLEGPSAFISNESSAPGTSTTTAQQREQIKAKRRVPNSQRKRTQVSCDACKTRRCKCVRLNTTPGPGDLAPCKLCTETGIPCVTSMPRKQRVYGSVENLDKRYRALEALVSGICPELNPRASAEEIVAFGRERAIEMPEFGESSDQSLRISSEPAIKPEGTESYQHATDLKREISNPNLIIAGTDNDKTILPPSYLAKFGQVASPQPSTSSAVESVIDSSAENTGLILDATGRPHYIGPCGSLAFFGRMRDIFTQRFEDSASLLVDRGPFFVNNPLAASLGGTGDRGRAAGSPSGRGSSSPPGHNLDHLDGDSPPQICEDMLKNHPNDPEFWRYRKRVSELELPSREHADACIHAFFQYVHPNFILFHRHTFQRAYEKMWRCWDSHRNQGSNVRAKEISVSVGWLCCLYMMFVLGSRALPQSSDSLEFQRKWFAVVDKLPPLLGTSSLPNVCAYMLLSLYYHNTNDRTSAWTFQGAACRLAIALGMHRESSSGLFDTVERQHRKLVWWTLYGYEQFLCCSLGRPSAIDDREMDVGIPHDEYMDANLLPPRYIEHSAQLNMLLAATRRGIFDPGFAPGRRYSRALEFLETVAGWNENLPKGLRPEVLEASLDGYDHQWRSATLLHVRYHHTLCFLTRPFLFETIQSSNGDDPLGPDAAKIRALSKICLTGAMRCGYLIVKLWRAGQVNGVTWIDIYYAYMCSLDISLALLSPGALRQGEAHPEIRNPNLIQYYTVEDMKDIVRNLCEVMSTIDVCGTNARFAKAAFEFASTLAIIPIEKVLSLGLQPSDAKVAPGDEISNDASRTIGVLRDHAFTGEQRPGAEAGVLDQGMAGIPGYYPATGMNLDFQGNYNYPQNDTMGNMQWDM